MRNAQYKSDDIKKICTNKLSVEFKKGRQKEFNGWFIYDSKKIARITIPKGKKPVPPKTYQSMAKQLKLNISQFDDLLDCPLKKPGYIEILKDGGFIDN